MAHNMDIFATLSHTGLKRKALLKRANELGIIKIKKSES